MKRKTKPSVAPRPSLERKIRKLEAKLAIASETLRAIQGGEVDALVVDGSEGQRIFTLKSADLPYRILVETMSEGAATIDLDGTILYCNQRFAQMMQTEASSVIGADVERFIRQEDREIFSSAFASASKRNTKCSLHVGLNATSWVSAIFSMSAVRLDTGSGVCVVATDLTEQRRFEAARADVERLSIERELRERFVSTLSHDLRNPLAAIKMSAQLIGRFPGQLEKDLASGARIVGAVNRADKMIQDLLDANLIRSGEKLPLQFSECDLRETTADTLADLSLTFGDRFVLHGERKIVGYWSCDQLRRLVENLATNAVKYGAVEKPIHVELKENKNEITLSVHNEGNSLSEEEQQLIFKPFSRARNALSSGHQGWGLGLTLVRGVAEAHGGNVCVESAPAMGTTFKVVLPRDSRPFQPDQR